MRIVLLSTAAIALSGCSWLGLGGNHSNTQAHQNPSYGTYKAQPAQKSCTNCNALSRWNVEGGYSKEFITGGNALESANNDLVGITPNKTSLKSAYENGDRLDVGVSYALNPNRKLILNGYRSDFDGERRIVGTQGASTLEGDFDNYRSFGIEGGIRQYALPVRVPLINSIRPYVEARGGIARVGDIDIDNVTATSGAGVETAVADLEVYDTSYVPTATGLIGFETPLFKRMTVGIESGIRYSGRLDTANGGFAGGDGANKWSVPVSLRGRYRF